jgi:hypothetical protein
VRISRRFSVLPVVMVALLALGGCAADDRVLVGPETASEQRATALADVTDSTTLPDGEGVSLVASRSVDSCAAFSVAMQPSYPHQYRCGAGHVALYSVEGVGVVEAAAAFDAAIVARGCVVEKPVSADPALAAVDAAPGATEPVRTFVVCGEGGGAQVIFAAVADLAVRIELPSLPVGPGGTYLLNEPSLGDAELSVAASRSNYIAVLAVGTDYFETQVCDGLHLCDGATLPSD